MLTHFAPASKKDQILRDYNQNNNDINLLIKLIESKIQHQDSYYLGRTIGDVAMLAIGIYGIAAGINKIIVGFSIGAGGAAGSQQALRYQTD